VRTGTQLGPDIRQSLEELGPAFAAFGRYLSARVDLLPYPLCENLAAIPDRAATETAERVCAIFIRETGARPEAAFQRFDPRPHQSRLYWQSHYAQFAGADVTVRFIRPDIPAWIENADNFEVLQGGFEAWGVEPDELRQAVAEFVRELAAHRTFESDLAAFAALGRDAHSFEALAAPRIYRHLSTPYVLVHDCVSALATFSSSRSPDQARMLCLAWLHQALEGEVYPAEPHLGNVAITADGRIVFTNGPFATIPAKVKTHLADYLAAVAAENQEAAYTHFAKVAGGGRRDDDNPELRRRFLQMVAFRDGFWNDCQSVGLQPQLPPFAEQVLIHWRIARMYGELDESVNAFYRGLFHVVRSAAALAPGRDSLLEALYDLRIQGVFGNAKELVRPAQVAGLMEQYATAFMAMPANLDRLLTGITSGELPPHEPWEPLQHSAGGERPLPAIIYLLAIGGAALMLQTVCESVRSPTFDHVLVALFLVCGLVLLWTGGRWN
jgi:hypothetical protein